MEVLQKRKPGFERKEILRPTDYLESQINYKLLNEIREKLDKLHSRLSDLERKFEERVPTKVLGEDSFKKEVQDGDEVVNKIISEMKNLMEIRQRIKTLDKTLTLVESKRIEKIKSLLKRHEQMSSTELSQLLGLSRTRCNEYFKMMERLNMVEPVLVKKEKFYKLRNS